MTARPAGPSGPTGGVVFGSGGFAHSPGAPGAVPPGPDRRGIGSPVEHRRPGRHRDPGRRGLRGHAQRLVEPTGARSGRRLRHTRCCDVWSVPGDGMLMVNRFGVRAVGEKREYESRGRVHHMFADDEYVNRVMFMVYDAPDRRALRRPLPDPAGRQQWPTTWSPAPGWPDWPRPWVTDWRRSKSSMPAGIAPVALDRPRSPTPSPITIARFNDMAEHGHDDEFGRGTEGRRVRLPRSAGRRQPAAQPAHVPPRRGRAAVTPSPWSGTTFDTNSGPRIGTEGQILGTAGPIGGLYGAGNCVDSRVR